MNVSEKRIIKIGAAVSSFFGTMGAGLITAAQTQGMEWAMVVGTVFAIFGASLGAAIGGYSMTSREPVIGTTRKRV